MDIHGIVSARVLTFMSNKCRVIWRQTTGVATYTPITLVAILVTAIIVWISDKIHRIVCDIITYSRPKLTDQISTDITSWGGGY